MISENWLHILTLIFSQFWQPMCWLISFVCTPIWVKLNQTCSLHENWSDRTEYCWYSRFLGFFFFKRLGGQQLYHQIYRKMICLATNCYLEKRKKKSVAFDFKFLMFSYIFIQSPSSEGDLYSLKNGHDYPALLKKIVLWLRI